MLSNLLIAFAIIVSQYNSIQGKNNLIHSLFTYGSLSNMTKFSNDLKLQFIKKGKVKLSKKNLNNPNSASKLLGSTDKIDSNI